MKQIALLFTFSFTSFLAHSALVEERNFWELAPVFAAPQVLPATFDFDTHVLCVDNVLTITRLHHAPVFTTMACPAFAYGATAEGVLVNYPVTGVWIVRYDGSANTVSGITPSQILCASEASQILAVYNDAQIWQSHVGGYVQLTNAKADTAWGCSRKGFIAWISNTLYSLNLDGTLSTMTTAGPSAIYGTNTRGAVACFGNGTFIVGYDGSNAMLARECPSHALFLDDTKFVGCFSDAVYSISFTGAGSTKLATTCPVTTK